MHEYGLYHAFPILTKIRQENLFGWVAIGLPMSSPAQLCRATLVGTKYFYLLQVWYFSCTYFTYIYTNRSSRCFGADTKRLKPNLRVMHVRDLNFVLRSEIFMHFDDQLRASYLILGCNPVYSTWQSFNQALLVDNPLLSYINVRHPNILPSSLTVGEARDFGPCKVRTESLAPLRDTAAEKVSRNRAIHRLVEEPQAQVQV